MERRGIHVMMGDRSKLSAVERLVREIAPSLYLNYVILEINGYLQYDSHPEVSEPDSMTATDASALAELARANSIELVPMYNCLGHQSWRDKPAALLRAHPEFNEAPDMDATAEDFYCMSWCPNHPDINPLLFDLLDELVEAFGAKAFHVGMDEVFVLGECPRCKGTSNADLFAKAVNDYHGHLVGRRGVEMQMWGDRLLDAEQMGYGAWESSENDDVPSVGFFLEKGFRVWPAGWNKPESIGKLMDVSRRNATSKMLGYLATTWTDVDKLAAGLSGEPVDDEKVAAIVKGVKLGAELALG
jgi:hypothetical protein